MRLVVIMAAVAGALAGMIAPARQKHAEAPVGPDVALFI